MQQPLVSVICLCYNQEQFVEAAINSVAKQTYSNLELIIVDDASTDNSVSIIKSIIANVLIPTKTIFKAKNEGNCKAFNQGLKLASGKYIIDLAADDELFPDRISIGVTAFDRLPEDFGVHYCEAVHIDSDGKPIEPTSVKKPPKLEGDLYQQLIENYWINAATMMIKKSVLDRLDGYDETLSYEDFDFWIRSSRDFKYAYANQTLVRKRVIPNSLGNQQKKLRNRHENSTFKICEKIKNLNKTEEEDQALRKRIIYEIKRSLRLLHIGLIWKYFKLYRSV